MAVAGKLLVVLSLITWMGGCASIADTLFDFPSDDEEAVEEAAKAEPEIVLGGEMADMVELYSKHLKELDYQWIAGQELMCPEAGDGCGILHQIKGEASLELAREGVNPEFNLGRAVAEFKQGIEMTKVWGADENPLTPFDCHNGLCEALAGLQLYKQGDDAARLGREYLEAAETFADLYPGHPAAICHISVAQTRDLQLAVENGNGVDRADLCMRLDATLYLVERTIMFSDRSGEDYWPRYRDRFVQVQEELTELKNTMNHCL